MSSPSSSSSSADSAMLVPTNEENRQRWNVFSSSFQQYIEPMTAPVGVFLAQQLHLHKARSVLELGAGPGSTARVVAGMLSPGCKYVVTDLAEDMVSLARSVLPPSVEVRVANAQAIDYPDASFDACFANLALQLVPDPDQMLRECRRVLVPGGYAAFSVWGRQEHTNYFFFMPKVLEAMGMASVDNPNVRTNFHLNDMARLKQMAMDAGFSSFYATYVPAVLPVENLDHAVDAVLKAQPGVRKYLSELPSDQSAEVTRRVREEVAKTLEAGQPIGFETIVMVVKA